MVNGCLSRMSSVLGCGLPTAEEEAVVADVETASLAMVAQLRAVQACGQWEAAREQAMQAWRARVEPWMGRRQEVRKALAFLAQNELCTAAAKRKALPSDVQGLESAMNASLQGPMGVGLDLMGANLPGDADAAQLAAM